MSAVLLPARRAAMPLGVIDLTDLARAVPINRPGIPPHYHIQLLEMIGNQKVPARVARRLPGAGQQDVYAVADRACIPCDLFRCEWFLKGRTGVTRDDSGAQVEFNHPAGVECGDFARCPDPNCPCPDRVLRWPDGTRKGHISSCRYCLGTFRHATAAQPVRTVSRSEAWDRVHDGVETIHHIRRHGL